MNAEAEEPMLVTRGRETERERVDGRYDLSGRGDGETLVGD